MIKIDQIALWWIIVWLVLPHVFLLAYGKDESADDFLITINDKEAKTINYLTAGLMAQPEGAFKFILRNSTLMDGRIVLIPYGNSGVDFLEMKKNIIQDIKKHPGVTKVRFFGISMGCNINQLMREENLGIETEFYDINPCYTSDFLQKNLKIWLPITSVLFRVGVEMLGLINLLPIYPIDGGEFISLRTLSEQLLIIGWNKAELDICKKNSYVIMSEFDEFLDNKKIETYYLDENRISIQTSHGKTVANENMYLYAIEEFLK